MPSRPPPPPPKGTKYPGAGRAKGTPNKITVEVRELVGQLVTDAEYQFKLRQDFRARKVHPTIEALIWTYHLGKPRQDIHIDARVDVNAKLDEERRLFASLDVRDLEHLAAKSQALVDEATALSKARQNLALPQQVVPDVKDAELPTETLRIMRGSDNLDYATDETGRNGDDDPPDAEPHLTTPQRTLRARNDDDDDAPPG